jgi:hypothetical protein
MLPTYTLHTSLAPAGDRERRRGGERERELRLAGERERERERLACGDFERERLGDCERDAFDSSTTCVSSLAGDKSFAELAGAASSLAGDGESERERGAGDGEREDMWIDCGAVVVEQLPVSVEVARWGEGLFVNKDGATARWWSSSCQLVLRLRVGEGLSVTKTEPRHTKMSSRCHRLQCLVFYRIKGSERA